MKSKLIHVKEKDVEYESLAFCCPGCSDNGRGSGLHILPVNTDKTSPSWEWDGNLEKPTLSPSILTKGGVSDICHSFLRGGVFEYLSDCTHSLVGQKVEIPDLPDWIVNEGT